MTDNSFRFHVPISIVKAGEEGKEMILGGIASTRDVDREGETLIPEGFDYSYLVNNGYINWHHQLTKDPSAVIGEPTSAQVTPQGLYIEGKLYSDSPMAKKAYELAKTLEKNSKTRRLGWSVEGKVINRDPSNPKKVTKARITGVALTPMPINPNTMVHIIKAMDVGDETVSVEVGANGGQEYLLNENIKDGGYVRVNNAGEITINLGKSMNTTNARALIKEDLEGGVRTTLIPEKKKCDRKFINKGEVYEHIFRTNIHISPSEARMIYNKIVNNKNKEL